MANKKKELIIVREFDAPKELVFQAFTNADALAEWWGPVDFKTSVIKMDLRINGIFHYKMESPALTMWGRFVYKQIREPDLLEFIVSFSNENAEIIRAPIAPTWPLEMFNRFAFTEKNGSTTVTMTAFPVNPTDVEYATFIDMQPSVNKGYNASMDQLDIYLNAQFKLRQQNKKNTRARTTTYLNFPGNTEEAFNFYKTIFGGEFIGNGMQRFGDIPPQEGQTPIADNIKKMILHVELPVTGGHVLMGTDAPKEMGFTLTTGNNMHICLEPDSRKETKRIFDGLSAGGTIDMPLQDMFFGAYFGSCTDKFGINWMVNCTAKD